LAGNEVGDETIVRPGQLLMFLRRAGEKGARSVVPLVTVTSGPYAEELPVANLTVREIRARCQERFAIHPRSRAFLAGEEVNDDRVVRPGQMLMFARRSGTMADD
jgi:hypothetical protein